jgi:hypothetical protein
MRFVPNSSFKRLGEISVKLGKRDEIGIGAMKD